MQPAIEIINLEKSFKGAARPALAKISTHIMPGQVTGLVGPDGAGKTTLMRLIIGLLHPTSGSVTVNGLDTKTQAGMIHEISGYMPQKFGLYEDLSVIENLILYADLRNIIGEKRDIKFNKLLQFTDLTAFQTRLAGKLSGGMKQKLGLACALIGDPKILLLDEPNVGVDPMSRRELWKMVQALLSEEMAVVWATSYLDEAEKCDSVILLHEGQKLYDGTPVDILQNVQDRTWQIQGIEATQKRKMLSQIRLDENIIDGIIQGQHIRVVLRDKQNKPELQMGQWIAVKPSFEDAFIDLLGGSGDGKSELSKEIKPKSMDDMYVIDVRGLTKKFDTFVAVQDNTFKIKRGEIFGLLGPNGAGKSTTFKMMCGLLRPTAGEAYINGLNLKTAISEARSRIGYMAQKFSLYGNLNVLQNLNFFSGLYGLTGKVQKKQVELMIAIFNFKDHLKMNASTLPLGFKQRLALACSVMHQPDVLFLDEPTSGVDPITRREFWSHINGMVEKGVTILVTTHFMDEAEYCDRIGLIYKGINIATGTPDYLKKLVQSEILLNPTLEEAFIELITRQVDK